MLLFYLLITIYIHTVEKLGSRQGERTAVGSGGNALATVYRRLRLQAGKGRQTTRPRYLYYHFQLYPRCKAGVGYDVGQGSRLRRQRFIRRGEGMSIWFDLRKRKLEA